MMRRARLLLQICALVVLPTLPLQAQPKLENTRETIEIRGDSWTLRYGRGSVDGRLFPSSSQDRIYFTHGGWLRVIDLRKGVVENRWHFPGQILKVSEKEDLLEIMLDDGFNWVPSRTVLFDLRKPDVPFWPTPSLRQQRVSSEEIQAFVGGVIDPARKAEEAKGALPQLEEAVRRDTTSPWLRMALGAVLRETGDARAAEVLRQAVTLPSTDFSELLSMSGDLDAIGETDLAREAFERGYRDFLAKGNDPRAVVSLLGRLMLYRRTNLPPNPWISPGGREQVDRLYRLAPFVEGSSFGWKIYSERLAEAGLNEESRLFATRAAESEQATSSSPPMLPKFTIERILMLFCASMAAALAYIIVLTSRYSPEHRIWSVAQMRKDATGRKRWIPASPKRTIAVVVLWFAASYVFFFRVDPKDIPEWVELGIIAVWILLSVPAVAYVLALLPGITSKPWESFVYWSPRERRIFAAIVLTGWIAFGLAAPFLGGLIRNAFVPLSFGLGSLAGPSTITYFEERVPPSSERDLVLALAYQQDKQPAKAEALYRTVPQFAEAWNNLGVLFKERGSQTEADAAFEQALALDPGLEEARLNRGLPTSDFWTEQHRRYFPERPMIALPRPKNLRGAFLGASAARILASGLLGPFAWLSIQEGELFDGPSRSSRTPIRSWSVIGWLLVPLLILAVVVLFSRRRRDVTQPPPKFQWIIEVLAPGSALGWHYLTVPVLVGWSFSILQLLYFKSQTWLGSPFLNAPSVARPFGVPFDIPDLERFTHPSDVWIYGLPIALFALNLMIVGISANYKNYKK